MAKVHLNDEVVKKVLGYASIGFAGLVAVYNAISDQKKDAEFEELKKAVETLQNK